jgi:UDP-glucose 4-epimerase
MRMFVTGAAGFLGSTLVDRLLAEGHRVVGVDNLSTGAAVNLDGARQYTAASPDRFTFVRVDMQAPELGDIIAGTNPDVVFHLAAHPDLPVSASDPQFDARSNVLGTINLCEASRHAGVARIIYAGSGEPRDGALTPIRDSVRFDPPTPHAAGKLAGELYLRAYARLYDLVPICLALSSVYGPRQTQHGGAGDIARLANAMLAGRPVAVPADATSTRDYVYVDDVVDAFVRASQAPIGVACTYHIGTGRQTTLSELGSLISALIETSSPAHEAAARTDDMNIVAVDAAPAERDLGWWPVVGLVEGIARTIRWMSATATPPQPAVLVDA